MTYAISRGWFRCVVVMIIFGTGLAEIQAAEITLVKKTSAIWIIGDIEDGDAMKFQLLLAESDFVRQVILVSKGGSLAEAMVIGRMIRQNFIATKDAGGITPSNRCGAALSVLDESENPMTRTQERNDCACYSACFVIWVGGIPRRGEPLRASDGRGGLGIHRPRFNSKFFSGLTATEAETQYDLLVEDTKNYLKEMDVPNYLIEKMFSVSSSNMYLLSREEIDEMSMPPAIAEWFKSRCGELSASERAELGELQFAKLLRNLPTADEPRHNQLWKQRMGIIRCQNEAIKAEQESRRAELRPTTNSQSSARWTCKTEEAGSSIMSIYEDYLVLDTLDGEKMFFPLVEEPEPGWIIGSIDVDPELGNLLLLIELEPVSGKTVRQLVDVDSGEVAFHSEGTCTPVN